MRRTLVEIAEELAEQDEISDAVYDLRGEVFNRMQGLGFCGEDEVGSDHHEEIDKVVRLLLEMV